jgi:hypothetical protein
MLSSLPPRLLAIDRLITPLSQTALFSFAINQPHVAALKKHTLCHFSANLWHFSAL